MSKRKHIETWGFDVEGSLFLEVLNSVLSVNKARPKKEFNEDTKAISSKDGVRMRGGDINAGDGGGWIDVYDKHPIKPRFPHRTIFIDMDSEAMRRHLFHTGVFLLDPKKLYAKEYGLCVSKRPWVKWLMFLTIPKLPKHWVSKHGTAVCAFEQHYRIFSEDWKEYCSQMVSWNGKTVEEAHTSMRFLREESSARYKENNENFDIQLAVLDDLLDCWMTEIVFGQQTVIIGTDWHAVQDLTALRDGPLTKAERKKAILHWVREHMRRKKGGEKGPVSAHTRGIQEVDIDDFHLRISPSPLLLLEHKHPERFDGSFSYHLFSSLKDEVLLGQTA